MARHTNKRAQAHADRMLLAGCKKHLPKGFFLVVDGRKLNARQLVAALEARVERADAVTTRRESWRDAVRAHEANLDETRQLVKAARHIVATMFGNSPTILADFGLAAPRPPKRRRTAAPHGERSETERTTPAPRVGSIAVSCPPDAD